MATTVSREVFELSIGFLNGGDNVSIGTVEKTAETVQTALDIHTDNNGQLDVGGALTEIDFLIEKANQVKRALIREVHTP